MPLRPTLAAISLTLSLACTLAAQGYRCSLVGRHHLRSGYTDVTGFVAGNGGEYALLAGTDGVAVIDCSQPQAPVERGFIAAVAAGDRRVRVAGRHAYVVAAGVPGVRVIDLGDPDHPIDGGVVGGSSFGGGIDLGIDGGRIHCAGSSTGIALFYATGRADSPVFVGSWLDGTAPNLVQQVTVQRGIAYAAMPNQGRLRLYDLGVWPPLPLGSIATPANCTAAIAVDAGRGLCASSDGCAGGMLHLIDCSNPLAPRRLGQFTPAAASIPGRADLQGDYCHVAWHSEGYRCVDVHDPEHPLEVAFYDTQPGAPGGSNGAVACFAALPSGHVFVADRGTGLYVLRPQLSHLSLSHTPLPPQGENAPYRLRVHASASTAVWSVSLTWQVDNALPVVMPMLALGGGDYVADIPPQPAPAVVRYHLIAADGAALRRLPENGELQFEVGSVRSLFADGFETATGWTHGALAGVDEWQIGAPHGRIGLSGGVGWSDPAAAFAGRAIAGLDLGGAGSDGAYADLGSSWLQSPPIPTQGARHLHLRYRRWLSLAAGDSARVLVNNRVIASTTAAVQDRDWQPIDFDIGAITDTATSVSIRFELNTDAATAAGGLHLDDIEVYWLSDQLPAEHYGSGSAGSGGFVPGLDLSGDWHLGSTAVLKAGQLLGGGACVLLLGTTPGNVPVLGAPVLVGGNALAWQFAFAGGAAPGTGVAAFSLPIPNLPQLDGVPLFAQVLGFDSGAAGGVLSCSDGLQFRICSL